MPKIPECDRCLLCAHNPFLVCAVHPSGPEGDSCLDFRPDPELEGKRFVDFLGWESRAGAGMADPQTPIDNPFDLDPEEELWEPEGATYYNGELILQPLQRWTREEQMELLNWHPLFTEKCPRCSRQFPQCDRPPVHWDCECGWMDDTV